MIKKLLLTLFLIFSLATSAFAAFPTTGYLDQFNRTNEGPPMTGWTSDALAENTGGEGLIIVSNQCKSNSAGSAEDWWNTQYFGNLEAYYTVITKQGNGNRIEIGFITNPPSAVSDGYNFRVTQDDLGNDAWLLKRMDDGVDTNIDTYSGELNVNDIIGISRIGGVIKVYQNGSEIMSASDSTYTGAMYIWVGIKNTTGVIDDFGGGTYRRIILIQ